MADASGLEYHKNQVIGGKMSLFDIVVGVFEEKMKASVAECVQGIIDKKKIEEIFNELCARQEGYALFENQGTVDGIDFYVLTNILRTELIENALSFYREDDRKKAEDVRQRLYREVQEQTGAVTKEQKESVTHFLEHVYELTGFYLLKCLGKEDRLAINISSVKNVNCQSRISAITIKGKKAIMARMGSLILAINCFRHYLHGTECNILMRKVIRFLFIPALLKNGDHMIENICS